MRSPHAVVVIAAVMLGAGCAPFPSPADGGRSDFDSGELDASTPDASTPDASTPDASTPDAGVSDGGADAGGFDDALFGAGAERRIAAVPVPVDATAAPACSATVTSGCLYRPQLAASVTEWVFGDDVSYVDVLGRPRTVRFAVYRAASTPPGAPVVLLSHGGAGGIEDPTQALREWASILAGAGYVAVSLAHSDYPMTSTDGGPSDYDQLCDAVGVPHVPGFMCALKVSWQRPLDLAAVEAWLEARVATNTAWAGAVDLGHLGHMGHSAGASAAMMVGGVTRNFRCAQPFGGGQGTLVPCLTSDLVSRRLPPVRAVVAYSPQGPGTEGFMTESYGSLEVPMLMGTGLEDGDPGEPANRLALFPLLPPGPRWKVYLDHVGAQHGLFGGDLDACRAQTTPQRCAELRGALTATALAFLDAHLRGRVDALTWLGSGNLAALSNGVATVTAR